MKVRNLIFLLTIILLTFLLSFRVMASHTEEVIFPPDSLQMVVVVTPNLKASSGTIQLFEREDALKSWKTVSKPEKVVVGKNGLGWSHKWYALGNGGHKKKEGDKKAPAGFFYLRSVFGYALANDMSHLNMPYRQVNKKIKCIDDVNSKFYNRIIDSSTIRKKDWNSHEDMRRNDNLYRLGIVLDYNTSPIRKGMGSCIFLHLWRSSFKPTVGCTAIAPNFMEKLISWLELEKKPLLVQLPKSTFEKISKNWHLPKKNSEQRVGDDKANKNDTMPGSYPEASSRRLTYNDLPSDKRQLKIMRNEIFARHGYIFKSAAMKKYFNAKAWYNPQFDKVYDFLTPIERYNLKLIKQHDK